MATRSSLRIPALVLATAVLLTAAAPAAADPADDLEAEAAARGMSADELLEAFPYVNGDPDLGFEAVKRDQRGNAFGKLRAAKAHKAADDGPGLGPDIRPAHAGLMSQEERDALKEQWAEAKAARKTARRAAEVDDDDDGPGIGPDVRPPHAGPMTKDERDALRAEWQAAKDGRKAARQAAKVQDDDDERDDEVELDDADEDDDD